MIDEKKLVEDIIPILNKHNNMYLAGKVICCIDNQPKVGEWIPCSERLPKEHDSMFSEYKGTDKWYNGMFEKISDTVIVTAEYDDGSRTTMKGHTVDGKWKLDTIFKCNVIAWMSLPEPYRGDIE